MTVHSFPNTGGFVPRISAIEPRHFPGLPDALDSFLKEMCKMLPVEQAFKLTDRIARAVDEAGEDLSLVEAQFLFWLLTDKMVGLTALVTREDVKDAIAAIACMSVAPCARGERVTLVTKMMAVTAAERIQVDVWTDYKTTPAKPPHKRVDWMACTAVTNAVQGNLLSAIHSAAVAWTTPVTDSARGSALDYYQVLCDQLVAIIANQKQRNGAAA